MSGKLEDSVALILRQGPPGGLLFTADAHSTNKLQKTTTTSMFNCYSEEMGNGDLRR